MTISDDKTLKQVQSEFSGKFPNLKIEFYKDTHQAGEGSPARAMLDAEKTIAQSEGDLSIDGHKLVKTLESDFLEKYGLNVQVFRKSGDLWLQTTSTDEWTLADQNRRGAPVE
jgi:hypothetical protein